jgi:tetratricopeptide (TPR) repeat protein
MRCFSTCACVFLSFSFSAVAGRAQGATGLAATAQAAMDGAPAAGASGNEQGNDHGDDHGRILLVLPFDNRTGQPSLDWMREAAADLLSSRFASAGFAPMTRADRIYALDHLGLPQNFQPSRASSVKLAQTLDADSIVVGDFRMDGTQMVAEAQLVDVPHLRMTETVTAEGELKDMIAVFDSLAWKLARQLDPSLGIGEDTFVAEGKGLRLDSFEQYIRGITEPDHAERLRHLEQAVKLSPGFSPAWMALGREQYQGQQYEEAAAAFAKVDREGPDGLEAGFYGGLSLMFSGNYAQAEKAFAEVAKTLPLAEVVNNEAVAASRQGHDGTALYVQAASADPNAADYHFNLAVSLKQEGKTGAALGELAQCLKLRPTDSEAQTLEAAWKDGGAGQNGNTGGGASGTPAGASPDPAGANAAANVDPLERIARAFDAAAFKQAAQMMDQMDATRLAALSPKERAQKLCAQAKGYLDRGLLLEAERLYQAAVTADGSVADGHAGLAEVRERTGDGAEARKEAKAALELAPSADAYLVLGRLDLADNDLNDAGSEAAQALKLEPGRQAAKDLARQIEAHTGVPVGQSK